MLLYQRNEGLELVNYSLPNDMRTTRQFKPEKFDKDGVWDSSEYDNSFFEELKEDVKRKYFTPCGKQKSKGNELKHMCSNLLTKNLL